MREKIQIVYLTYRDEVSEDSLRDIKQIVEAASAFSSEIDIVVVDNKNVQRDVFRGTPSSLGFAGSIQIVPGASQGREFGGYCRGLDSFADTSARRIMLINDTVVLPKHCLDRLLIPAFVRLFKTYFDSRHSFFSGEFNYAPRNAQLSAREINGWISSYFIYISGLNATELAGLLHAIVAEAFIDHSIEINSVLKRHVKSSVNAEKGDVADTWLEAKYSATAAELRFTQCMQQRSFELINIYGFKVSASLWAKNFFRRILRRLRRLAG